VTALVATSAVGICDSARSVGMGFTGTGLADQADAWYWNPAGLAHMEVCPMLAGDGAEPKLVWQGIVANDFGGDVDMDSIDVGGVYGTNGFAVGRVHSGQGDWTDIGIGFGTTLGSKQWSGGISVVASEWGTSDQSETTLNAGVMYQWNPALGKGKPAKLGVLAEDLTEEWGDTIYTAGLSFWLGKNLLIAADVYDLNDDTAVEDEADTGREFNVGAEWQALKWLALRAGSQDGDFTYGAGVCYKGWKLDAGFVTWDEDYPAVDTDGQLFSITKDFVVN